MMLGQYTQALEDARLSVQLDPAFVKGYVRVAKCCISLGDVGQANQALSKAAELEPANAAVKAEEASVQALEKFAADAEKASQAGDYRKVRRRDYMFKKMRLQ